MSTSPLQMEQCSSISNVTNCDDLLVAILVRLPTKSVFKFKCVSRRWKGLISDPSFARTFKSRRKDALQPLLGFFQGTTKLVNSVIIKDEWFTQLSFLSTCQEGMCLKSIDFINKLGFFIGSSSQGLILCGRHPATFLVCNPVTNQWSSLPKPSMRYYELAIGFSCDEHIDDGGMVHFKVIRANVRPQAVAFNTLPIETFSSRTGEWKKSLLTSPSNFSLVPFSISQVVGEILLWPACCEGTYQSTYIAAYDPNMEKDRLWLIKLPTNGWGYGKSGALGISSDGRLQCAFGDLDGFEIWILNNKLSSYSFASIISHEEWRLSNVVSYKTLSIEYSQIIDLDDDYRNSVGRSFSIRPLLVAFHPQNSKLIYLWFRRKIFIYDFETKRVQLVQYHGTVLSDCDYDLFPYFHPTWPPSLGCFYLK